jgi:hypothetical protein
MTELEKEFGSSVIKFHYTSKLTPGYAKYRYPKARIILFNLSAKYKFNYGIIKTFLGYNLDKTLFVFLKDMETQGSQFVEYELHVMEDGKLTFVHFLNIEVNSDLSDYQLAWIDKKLTSIIKHSVCSNCIFYNQKALVQCAVIPNRDFENGFCIEKVVA